MWYLYCIGTVFKLPFVSLIESYYPNTCGRFSPMWLCIFLGIYKYRNSFNCHHIQLLTAQCVQPTQLHKFCSTIIQNTTQPDKETALRRVVGSTK